MAKRPISDKQGHVLLSLYRDTHLSLGVIGARFNLSNAAVTTYARSFGVTRNPQYRKPLPAGCVFFYRRPGRGEPSIWAVGSRRKVG